MKKSSHYCVIYFRYCTDLARVRADTAAAMFILSDQHSADIRDIEKRTFMRAITAQDYNPTLKIFVQALSTRSVLRLRKVGRTLGAPNVIDFWLFYLHSETKAKKIPMLMLLSPSSIITKSVTDWYKRWE